MVDEKDLVPASENENAKQKEEAVKSYVAQAFRNHRYNQTKALVKTQEEDDLLQSPAEHDKGHKRLRSLNGVVLDLSSLTYCIIFGDYTSWVLKSEDGVRSKYREH